MTRLAANADPGARPAAVGLVSAIEQYLGWLAIPLGRWDDSRAHLDRAAVDALEAADPERLSTALSFNAYRCLRRDDLAVADALSEAARRDSSVNIGLRTYETYQRAEVQARRCEHSSALALLAEADVMTDHLPNPDDLPDSGYWYPRRSSPANARSCYAGSATTQPPAPPPANASPPCPPNGPPPNGPHAAVPSPRPHEHPYHLVRELRPRGH